MGTTYHTAVGKVRWAQVYTPNRFGNYQISFYPESKEVRKAIKDTGFRGALKEDDDGNFFYNFRRKPTIKVKGEEVYIGPPKVTNASGEVITDLIGNDSIVEITYSIYDYNNSEHGQGKGSRLIAVKVIDLIPYTRSETSVTPTAKEPVKTTGAAPF
jgi:hypothetical protein